MQTVIMLALDHTTTQLLELQGLVLCYRAHAVAVHARALAGFLLSIHGKLALVEALPKLLGTRRELDLSRQ